MHRDPTRSRLPARAAWLAACWLLVACPGGGGAAETDPDARDLVRVEAAVDRALEYLAVQQQPDGTWPQGVSQRPNTGINALCLLAFMGRGHVPERGPYRETVGRAVDGLLAGVATRQAPIRR
jgi:hypothetical protein